MKYLFLLLLFVGFINSAQAEIMWSGSAGWRYLLQKNNDGLGTKNTSGKDTSETTVKTQQVRGDLNATSKGEDWDWGVGIRTYSSNKSEWLTVRNNVDLTALLENAYFRPHYKWLDSDWSVTVGRAKTVMLYDTVGQALWDKDNRWDGFGWAWKKNNFGFNMSQYVLGARSSGTATSSSYSKTEATEASPWTQSNFAYLLSFQPHIKVSVADEIEGIFAVGYHVWSGTGGNATSGFYENSVHGGTASPTLVSPTTVVLDNARQWQLFTDWSLPWSFRFLGEYIRNKEVVYGTRLNPTNIKAKTGAFALTLMYGKVKKANDWSLSYSYVDKSIGSVANQFTNGNMPPDNIGHLIDAKYALADNFTLGAKMELYREKSELAGQGVQEPAPYQKRRQTQDRYEFIAGVAF